MDSSARLNGIIGALENGKHAFSAFVPMDIQTAMQMSTTNYDSIVFEGEHLPWDIVALRDAMQFMLDRRSIASSASIAPPVTPLVRVPVNGVEMGQWHAKQALDTGVYGVVWPHISTVEEAYNAVAACRYPRLKDKPLYEPQGIRGDGHVRAARYWGLRSRNTTRRRMSGLLHPTGKFLLFCRLRIPKASRTSRTCWKTCQGSGRC